MAILLHVVFALGSIGYPVYAFIHPSKAKLQITYGLVLVTMSSGFYLVWIKPSHMVSACVMGLIYLGSIAFGVFYANRKLVRAEGR